MDTGTIFDVVVVGGGPAGATVAHELAKRGRSVLLLDGGGRIKPCGGAIPPRAIKDYAIPDSQIVARATSARMIAPSDKTVDMPAGNGFVGIVDREHFDEWLRERAQQAGPSGAPLHSSTSRAKAKPLSCTTSPASSATSPTR